MNSVMSHTMPSQRLVIVDGFRAIAIIAVVLFHVFPKTVPGGFIGVDIFFAISGFVIALRYLDPLISGEVTFTRFFARRIRRLLPACLIVVLVTTVLAFAFMQPKDIKIYGASLAAQAGFLQNVAFWQEGNYFDLALVRPLLHTWSLAVEEQFYLLFPFLVLAIRWRPKWATALMVLTLLSSLALGFVGMRASVAMTFFLLPFRVWEFMVGVLVAVLYKRWQHKSVTYGTQVIASVAVLGGVIMVIASIAGFREDAAFPGPQSILALTGTGLVMCAQAHTLPWLDRAFAHPVIQHIGQVSYSWYLWHWPVLSLHYLYVWREMTLAESVAALVIGYGLGVLSYFTVERWGQRSMWLRQPKNTIGLLLLLSGFSLVVGLAANLSSGFLDRFEGREKALHAVTLSIPPYRCPVSIRLSLDDRQFCQINSVPSGEGILLIGDSHADMMKMSLADMATDAKRPFYFLVRNCRVGDFGNRGGCAERDWPILLRQIKQNRITDVFVISYFARKFDPARFQQAVADVADAGIRVTISLPTPDSEILDPSFWIRAGKADSWPEWLSLSRSDVENANADLIAAMRQAANGRPAVRLIDRMSLLCPDRCRFAVGDKPLYHDEHHLTDFGAEYVSPLYRDAILGK